MKISIFIFLIFIGNLVLFPNLSYAQVELRPEWVRQLPDSPPSANFIYVYGQGEGTTEKKAELEALKNALYHALQESGLIGFEQQSKSLDEIFYMENVNVELLKTIIPHRRICQTPAIYISNTEVKIYVLLKVQKNKSKEINFDDTTRIECESKTFLKALKKNNKKFKSEIVTWNNFRNLYINYSNQFYFNTGNGITYGLFGGSFGGRHGGTVGFGYQLGVGAGHDSEWHYSGGIKIYPYNCFFLSANYGTLGVSKPKISNTPDGNFLYKGSSMQHGFSFLLGADICFGKNTIKNYGGVINIAIGYSPDMENISKGIGIKEGLVWNIGIGFVV